MMLASQNPIIMSQQLRRFDIVRKDRLDYLSLFHSVTPETRAVSKKIGEYRERALSHSDEYYRIPVVYEQRECGRYYPEESYGRCTLSYMPRSLRSFLGAAEYEDVDICNAAPTILYGVAKQYGLQTPYLRHFVREYEACMEELRACPGITDPKAYKCFMLFGSKPIHSQAPVFVNYIRAEMVGLFRLTSEAMPDLLQAAKEMDQRKREEFEAKQQGSQKRARLEYQENVRGCFLDLLYFQYESKVLMALEELGRRAGYWKEEVTLIHDGMWVFPVRPLEDMHLRHLETDVKVATNIGIKLKIKPRAEPLDIDISKLPDRVLLGADQKHVDAARVVFSYYQDKIKRDSYGLYVQSNRVWLRRANDVKENLGMLVTSIPMYQLKKEKDEDGESRLVEVRVNNDQVFVSRVVSSLKDMAWEKCVSTSFSSQMALESEGKLLYQDGFYEFRGTGEGAFVQDGLFDSFAMVHSRFPPRIQADIDFVKREVLDPIFDNTSEGLQQAFFHAVARSLAGKLDKATYIVHGPRNSGKSVIFQFLDNTFGSYCTTIPSRTFAIYDSQQEASRESSWVIDVEPARIVKMSEMPSGHRKAKIDGNKIKQFQSMKEGITARALYSEPRIYTSLATGFFLMNDVPEFAPADSMDRCKLFGLPNEFVTAEEKAEDPFNAYKKLARPEIEVIIRQKRYQDAFTHFVLESYRDEPVPTLDCMREDMEMAKMGGVEELYERAFEITGSAQDTVLVKDLKTSLDRIGVQDNAIAIGITMTKIIRSWFLKNDKEPPAKQDIKTRIKRGENRDKWQFHFIRLRFNVEDHDGAYAPGFRP